MRTTHCFDYHSKQTSFSHDDQQRLLTGITDLLFSERLYYEQHPSTSPNSTIRYGGCISSMEWKTGTMSDYASWDFSYDSIGRLTGSDYRFDSQSNDFFVQDLYEISSNEDYTVVLTTSESYYHQTNQGIEKIVFENQPSDMNDYEYGMGYIGPVAICYKIFNNLRQSLW